MRFFAINTQIWVVITGRDCRNDATELHGERGGREKKDRPGGRP